VNLKPGLKRSFRVASVSFCAAIVGRAFGQTGSHPTNVFSPVSTPADSIYDLALFVLAICVAIFIIVFCLLVYSVVKYRKREGDDGRDPLQIYGSNQIELAWTVIPVLTVVVLF